MYLDIKFSKMGRLTEILNSEKKAKPKLGSFLKNLRIKFSLSQEEICKKIDVSRPTLQKIETDKADITLLQAKKLSDFYNITLLDLVNCEDKMSSNIRLLFKEGQEDGLEKEIILPGKRYNLIQELTLYLLALLGAKSDFNEIVLNDILFVIEVEYLKTYKIPFLGLPFLKNNYGPTPLGLDKIIIKMEEDKLIEKIVSQNFKFPAQKYLPLRVADLKIFRADEIKLIDGIINTFLQKGTKDFTDNMESIEQYKMTEIYKKIQLY